MSTIEALELAVDTLKSNYSEEYAEVLNTLNDTIEFEKCKLAKLPVEGSVRATLAIDAMMKEYNYPCNPANAARLYNQ
jgi:hypothetical protein